MAAIVENRQLTTIFRLSNRLITRSGRSALRALNDFIEDNYWSPFPEKLMITSATDTVTTKISMQFHPLAR